MNISVTGGTGHVGRGVVPLLLAAGFSVRALVRPGSIGALPTSPLCTPVAGDPLSPDDVARALDGCDAVIHMIGTRRKQIQKTGLGYDEIDVGSIRVMVEQMRAAGIPKLVLLSAGKIGNSQYVQSKGRAERIAFDADLDWTILRPAFILGQGQRWPRMFDPVLNAMAFIPGYIGDVARRAGNITVEELANAMIWSLRNPKATRAILAVPEIHSAAREMAGRGHRAWAGQASGG